MAAGGVAVLALVGVGMFAWLSARDGTTPGAAGQPLALPGADDRVRPRQAGPAIPPATDFPGLLAYWTFDQGQGPDAPDSCGGPPARLKNVEWVEGVRGRALRFQGRDSYFDFGRAPRLNFGAKAPFTVAGWVQTTAPNRSVLLSMRKANDGSPLIGIDVLPTGKLGFVVRADGNENGPLARLGTAAGVNDGNWHHVALLREADTRVLAYLDGQAQGESAPDVAGGAITTDLRSVAVEFYRPKGLQFQGCVDEFCLFGRALTVGEIRRLAGRPEN
jgi:hypothetical protein